MAFPGIAHVAVTVPSVDKSRPWYEKLFGAKAVLDEDAGSFHHVVWLLEGGTLFGIHQQKEPQPPPDYNEFRPGLDHVGFGVANRGELERWQSRLEELGIEHGGIVDAHYGSGLSFRDPDNIALELFAPPG
jgi:catechol 2,3-dioxygenase-like lactoylglutathione lyase family enzyme